MTSTPRLAGETVSIGFFLAFMMWVMGNRKPLMLATAPVLVTLAIWLVFEKVLNLSMPAGILVDIL